MISIGKTHVHKSSAVAEYLDSQLWLTLFINLCFCEHSNVPGDEKRIQSTESFEFILYIWSKETCYFTCARNRLRSFSFLTNALQLVDRTMPVCLMLVLNQTDSFLKDPASKEIQISK